MTLMAHGTPILEDSVGDDANPTGFIDRLTRRLRIKLREHGVRTDLVRPTNTGMVELYLHAPDRFEDEA